MLKFRPLCNKIPFLSHQGLLWHHFVTPKTCLNSSATEYEEETCDLACETNFHTIVVAVVWCATIFRIQRMNPHFASKEIQIEKSGMYRTNSKIKNKLSQMSSFHKGMKIQKSIYWTVHKTFIFLKQKFDDCICLPTVKLSNFTMGTILGKGFAIVKGTSAMNCMCECLSKTCHRE